MLGNTSFISLALLTILINLQLCNCSKASVTFSDAQTFVDISWYNFGATAMNDMQQEFTVTAREGKKVNLYLLGSEYFYLTVYDGMNDSSPLISTDPYQSVRDTMLTLPMNITSSGQNMFLRINYTSVPIFDAIVTDYVQQDGCRQPVLSLNFEGPSINYNFAQNNASGCFYIIHSTPHYENIRSNVGSPNKQLDKIILHKGLKIDQQYLLTTTNLMSYIGVFDDSLLLYPKQTVSLDIGYIWLDGNQTLPVFSQTENTLMSQDYMNIINLDFDQESGDGDFFVLDLVPPVTSVQISYLSLLGNSSITVTTITRGLPLSKPVTYSASQFKRPFNVTYDCDQVQILYSVSDLAAAGINGFYGTFKDATIYPTQQASTIPSTTLPPVTTTKGSTTNSVIALIFTSLLMYVF